MTLTVPADSTHGFATRIDARPRWLSDLPKRQLTRIDHRSLGYGPCHAAGVETGLRRRVCEHRRGHLRVCPSLLGEREDEHPGVRKP